MLDQGAFAPSERYSSETTLNRVRRKEVAEADENDGNERETGFCKQACKHRRFSGCPREGHAAVHARAEDRAEERIEKEKGDRAREFRARAVSPGVFRRGDSHA